MQPARLRELRRRPRRGSLDRPIDGRLVRATLLVVALPLFIAVFTVSRSGQIAIPPLPASFDGAAAAALTTELSRKYVDRAPGTPGNADSARWLTETLAQYGLTAQTDTWSENVPGLGAVALHNVEVVVPGSTRGAILVEAHRDTSAVGPGANDNASGTAALIQLARAYASAGSSSARPKPLHTLVFLSSDAGAWGGLGARRFVTTSRLRHEILAAVVLDGLAGEGRPRLDIAGDAGHSPAPVLLRTAAARVEEQIGRPARLPSTLRQVVDLGMPFAYGDQAPFLGAHVSSLRLATADDSGASDVGDKPGQINRTRLARLGAAAQNLLGSLDAGGELAQGASPTLALHGRIVHGWALVLVFIGLLVPYAAGAVDLLARAHRRGVPLAPAFRALRRRLGFWLSLGLVLWIGAQLRLFPNGPPRPLPPGGPTASDWPVGGLALLLGAALVLWFVTRRRLAPTRPVTVEEDLAGYAAALAGLGIVAVLTAIVHPLALAFLLPSLYAWLWLPQTSRPWLRDVLFGIGLAGLLLVAISIGDRFDLGARTPLYLVELVTVGYIPWTTAALVLAWAAVAAQLGTLAIGRYAPYSSGARRPPRGPIREGVRRAVLAAQSRRR